MNFLENFFGRKKPRNTTLAPLAKSLADQPKKQEKFSYKPGDIIADRYEVVTILSGGMGVVYLCADHAHQHQPLALKTFKPQFLSSRNVRDRFLREGTIWVQLMHPNIVRAYGVERVGDGREVYLVMEWVAAEEGKEDASLRAWLQQDKPLSIELALSFALQIVRGMRYATTEIPTLVHRDLKPENVLVGRDGVIRVSDFGLARTLAGLSQHTRKSGQQKPNFRRTIISQGLVGTPLYMAPEQWKKNQPVDARTDIYAFGCILFEMVAGRSAIGGASLEELAKAHCTGLVRALPANLPVEVKALVERCMALDPLDRCQNWPEVETAVRVIYRRVVGKKEPSEVSTQGQGGQAMRAKLIATAWSYNAMGLSYYDIGHYDLAGGYFERVVWVGEQQDQPYLEAIGLGNLGNVCRAVSDVDRAIRYHKRQLKLTRRTLDRAEEADALGNLGNDYAKLGNINRAIVYYQQQIGLARELNDLPREGLALRNLGDAGCEVGRPQEAIKFYKYALKVARRDHDRASEGRILARIGVAHSQLGNIKKAVKYYNYALKIGERIGDRIGAGDALGYLGIAYRSLGDTQQAVVHLMKYLSISREAGLKFEEGRVLSKLGTIYLEEGDPEQAQEFFEDCLKIVRDLGDQMWLFTVLEQVGDCYRELDSIDQAIGFYEERLTVAKNIGNPLYIAKANHTLGNGYRNVRDAPRAHPYYEDALTMAEQLDDKPLIAGIKLDFGLLLCSRGDFDEALEVSEEALRILKAAGDKTGMKEARKVIAFIRRQRRW